MNYTMVKRLLAYQSQDELFKIIAKLSSRNDKADSWLLEYCQKIEGGENEKFIAIKRLNHYWKVAREIIKEANKYGGTHNENKGYKTLRKIEELVEEYEFSWEERQPIVDEMMVEFYEGNSGFEDTLVDMCLLLCRTDEEKLYLADKLKKSQSNYYRTYAANIFKEYGQESEFEETLSKNLQYGSDYIKLADYYKKKKQRDKAVQLVEEAVEKAQGRMDEVYEWLIKEYKKNNEEKKIIALYKKALKKKWNLDAMVDLMCQYYKDDYEKRKPYLLKTVEVCGYSEVKNCYDRCQRELKTDDFKKERSHLQDIVKDRNISQYLDILMEEHREEEVLHQLLKHPFWRNYSNGVDENHRLTKRLVKKYPMEIYEMYWQECERLCTEGNRDTYRNAVSILKEMRGICVANNKLEEWKQRFMNFMEKNKRKRILIGYIAEEKNLQS